MATGHLDRITRAFPALWGLLTVSYALAVVYRALTDHTTPGFPTYAGFSAVLTVWLDFYSIFHARLVVRLAVVLALVATVLLNIEIIASDTLHNRNFPLGRLAFTLLFAVLLYDKTRGLVSSPKPNVGMHI